MMQRMTTENNFERLASTGGEIPQYRTEDSGANGLLWQWRERPIAGVFYRSDPETGRQATVC